MEPETSTSSTTDRRVRTRSRTTMSSSSGTGRSASFQVAERPGLRHRSVPLGNHRRHRRRGRDRLRAFFG
jgi:hypothetical protein